MEVTHKAWRNRKRIATSIRNGGIAIVLSSRPRELPPQPLTEPDVNLSVHPALIVQLAREDRDWI